ncbi:MAG: hypothetical protein H6845_01680 [Alphaproteobacteria bacterium]|nr:MAG: hypothetical protein H6845_01680 [Alphaproteobacteria bacterium]
MTVSKDLQIDFVKANALGNDFIIIIDKFSKYKNLIDNTELIKKMSDRKLGIGCDQLIYVDVDYKVLFWNQDGSQAKFCGNGLKCLAKCFDAKSNIFSTASGKVNTYKYKDQVAFNLPVIPLIKFIDYTMEAYDVFVGNEHIVIFTDQEPDWAKITHDFSIYLEHKNIMCIWKSDDCWNIRSWERGVGLTMACGSGTMAAAVAIWHSKPEFYDSQLTFVTKVGKLYVCKRRYIWQLGDANIVAYGTMTLA